MRLFMLWLFVVCGYFSHDKRPVPCGFVANSTDYGSGVIAIIGNPFPGKAENVPGFAGCVACKFKRYGIAGIRFNGVFHGYCVEINSIPGTR